MKNLDKKILVQLENVGVFQNNKWLVEDVSLNVEKGKIVTLIGPNGSGKTTTAKIALGIHKNIKGKVKKFTDKIGYVPQKISIDWTLPIRVTDFMQLTHNLNENEIENALSLKYKCCCKQIPTPKNTNGGFSKVLFSGRHVSGHN